MLCDWDVTPVNKYCRMVVLWDKKHTFKSAATLLTKQATIGTSSGQSDVILCNLVFQGTAKLQEVKLEGSKSFHTHVEQKIFQPFEL